MTNILRSDKRAARPAFDPSGHDGERAYPRPPRPLDRLMVEQIMSELGLPHARREATVPLKLSPWRPRPNVFETPRLPSDPPLPWGAAGPRHRVRRTSVLPWIVLAMALCIGVGIWSNRHARARVVAQLSAITHHATAFVRR